jgi:hypothetical protein
VIPTVPVIPDTPVQPAQPVQPVQPVVPAVRPIYSVSMSTADRWLSGALPDAQVRATSTGEQVTIDFYGASTSSSDTLPLMAWVNTLTGDFFYAPAGTPLPYECYIPMEINGLGDVLAVGKGAFDVHLYINNVGVTQLLGEAQASALGLATLGYVDMGALFASAAPLPTPVALAGVGATTTTPLV